MALPGNPLVEQFIAWAKRTVNEASISHEIVESCFKKLLPLHGFAMIPGNTSVVQNKFFHNLFAFFSRRN